MSTIEKLTVATIVGTRPEIIRLSECIKENDRVFNQVLVHTGQNYDYELNQVFFDDLGLRKPDYFLEASGNNLGESIGNIIAKSYEVLAEIKPDAILVLGDTNSVLSAISAKRLKIPIFHMEAGNRCFDENVPEETNRRIADHISDINLPYSQRSKEYLQREGKRGDFIYVTGSPMREVLEKHREGIESSDVLSRLGLEKDKYFVVSAHREENIDQPQNFKELVNALNTAAETYGYPIIFSTHPRTWKRIESEGVQFNSLIRQMKPFGFLDYNHLQQNAFCVLSDSGTLAAESCLLGFPAVSLRTSTERPEAVEKAALLLGGVTSKGIAQAIELVRTQHERGEEVGIPVDYQDLNVSTKVARIIQSFTDYVNKNVWGK